MAVGNTAFHSGGMSKCLFPRKYAATPRRSASGQSSHLRLEKATVALTRGRTESGGFP